MMSGKNGQLGKLLVSAAILAALVSTAGEASAQCVDPLGECTAPCPAELSCINDADCDSGFSCLPYGTPGVPCNPGGCVCDGGVWLCTPDCSSQCVALPAVEVPSASPWGLLGLALILSVASMTILARRRRRSIG